MKSHALPMFVLGFVMLILASGLLLSGCGSNEAKETQAVTAVDEMTLAEAEAIAVREAELEQREQELEQFAEQAELKMQQIEARLDDVESREADLDVVEVPEPADVIPAFEPEPEPEPEPATVMVRLPVDTRLPIQFFDELSSETSVAGDPVRALVTEDIMREDRVAIPAGSEVFGTVVEATPQKKIGGQAQLTLRFDEVEMPSGYRAAIQASLDAQGKSQKKKDAAVIGGSTAGGAILGRVLGDDSKGAVIGGIIGAAAGTIAARKNQGDPVVLDAGSRAVIALELPIHVAVN